MHNNNGLRLSNDEGDMLLPIIGGNGLEAILGTRNKMELSYYPWPLTKCQIELFAWLDGFLNEVVALMC